MTDKFPDFADFFAALWEYKPFAWQEELAAWLAAGDARKPLKRIIAPTAAGKTALIDAWLWALAKTLAEGERRVPLRLFFVVDRRLVVDSAYMRAQTIADKLINKTELAAVAEALKKQTESDETAPLPLVAQLMRGGIPWERKGWCRSPAQPMAVCATVDQVGSRLLFRGYGVGKRQRSVQAGLIGCDSLLALDEAHLSAAFAQTLSDMMLFAKGENDNGLRPLQWVEMTATPRDGDGDNENTLICSETRGEDRINQRLSTGKRIEIVTAVEKKLSAKKMEEAEEKPNAKKMAREALSALPDLEKECKSPVVAVVVNTVALARAVYEEWKGNNSVDAILLTGRNRPRQRDEIIEQYKTRLLSDKRDRQTPAKPLLIAATQCIEAGADFDFDFIISEGAPLDMLRQRFGRVDRLGRMDGNALRGKIIGWQKLAFYGDATAATRNWLWQNKDKSWVINFAPNAMREKLAGIDKKIQEDMKPPTAEPPFLSPPLVRELERTTDGDSALIPLLLHGQRDNAEVFLLWRADLPAFDNTKESRTEIRRRLKWLRPQSNEMLSLPLWAADAWMSGKPVTALPDVESSETEGSKSDKSKRRRAVRCQRKKGDLHIEWLEGGDKLFPGDILVIRPEAGGCDEFGWNPESNASVTDIADAPNVMRLHHRRHPDLADSEEWGDWQKIARQLNPKFRTTGMEIHEYNEDDTTEGVCLIAAEQRDKKDESKTIELETHCKDVAKRVCSFARASGLDENLIALLEKAALWHDAGKAEPRFQKMLGRQTDKPLLARSNWRTRKDELFMRELAGIEWGERHEFWSVMLAKNALADMSAEERSLVLWLIGTHHGQARLLPLPPKRPPTHPADKIAIHMHGINAITDTPDAILGINFGWSGYWRDNRRRYGAWGLAYLESLLRLADMETAAEETAAEETA